MKKFLKFINQIINESLNSNEKEISIKGIPYKVKTEFIRFGDLPENNSNSTNWFTGEKEAGVSVYEAWHDPKVNKYILFPPEGETELGEYIGTQDDFRDNPNRPAYLLTGDIIKGKRGADLEYLLDPYSIKIIKKISLDDIVILNEPELTFSGEILPIDEQPSFEHINTESTENLLPLNFIEPNVEWIQKGKGWQLYNKAENSFFGPIVSEHMKDKVLEQFIQNEIKLARLQYNREKSINESSNSNITINSESLNNSLQKYFNKLKQDQKDQQERLKDFELPKNFNDLIKDYPEKDKISQLIQNNEISKASSLLFDYYIKQGFKDLNIRQASRLLNDLDIKNNPYDLSDNDTQKEITTYLKSTIKHMEEIENNIKMAISKIPQWNNTQITIIPQDYDQNNMFDSEKGEDCAIIFLGDNIDEDPYFSYFIIDNKIIIDDVLEHGDKDFFIDNNVEEDYFQLINNLRNPNKQDKIITVYTARPMKDREIYLDKSEIPPGIFVASSYNFAEGFAIDNKPRDIWKIKINSKYLIETLNDPSSGKQYQVIGKQNIPVEKISLIHTVK